MNGFQFDVGQEVNLALSDERGSVIGRAEYESAPSTYFVRYVAADGRQVEGWFDADAIK